MNDSSFRPTKVTLVTILLCSMLMLMGGAAVAPALPLINEVFPDSEFLISLIITLPSLAIAILGFVIGALADRFGKVRVLCASLAIFVIAGVSGFFLGSLPAILVGRFLVGIGVGGVSAAVSALIAEYYTGMDRAKVMSYQSAAMGVGILILEYTGGSLAEISWREPFLVYLIGIPILIMALISMREPSREHPDHASAVGEGRKTNKGVVIVCYITIFVVMLMAFLMPTKIPYFLDSIGESSSVAGLFLGIHGVANALTALMYRRLVQMARPFTLMGVGFLFFGFGLVLLMIDASVTVTVMTMVITGIGLGMISPAVVNTLASQSTAATSGKIMGGYTTCLNLGQFSISLVSVPLFALVGSSYPNLFFVMGVVALIAGAVYVIGDRMTAGRTAGA